MNPFFTQSFHVKTKNYLLILLIWGILVFSPNLFNYFVHDDFWGIVNNPDVKILGNLSKLFLKKTPLWSQKRADGYRILDQITNGYHFTNILLHSLNAFLFYLILIQVFKIQKKIEISLSKQSILKFFSGSLYRIESTFKSFERSSYKV